MTPAAQRPTGGPPPDLTLATTIAPSDTSTSIVVPLPDGPQIETGNVAVAFHQDIVFATRRLADGTTLDLRLDLLVPATTTTPGLVVYVPGGGFVFPAREVGQQRKIYLAEAGYAVASIDYRTVLNGATLGDAVADVKAAIRFLRGHANEFGFAADRTALWGESAGGYIAAMAALTQRPRVFDDLDAAPSANVIRAVIDCFGPSHLAKLADDFDAAAREEHLKPGSAAAAFVFGPGTDKSLADDPDLVAAADPASLVTPDAPPFLLLHGSADNLVSPSQTLLLHSALLASGVESTRYVLDGAGHGDIALMLGRPEEALPWSTKQTLGFAIDFLDRHLKN